MTIGNVVLLCTVPVIAMAQPVDPLDVMEKLKFYAQSVGNPWSLAEYAAYAGILQGLGTPNEWVQGASAYGVRFGSSLGGSAIRSAPARTFPKPHERSFLAF